MALNIGPRKSDPQIEVEGTLLFSPQARAQASPIFPSFSQTRDIPRSGGRPFAELHFLLPILQVPGVTAHGRPRAV